MISRGVIDGVPVFWAEGPAPLAAALTFRVGVRDETFRTAGITHLVEHLVMSTLRRRRHEYNACVDLTFTEFSASGRSEAVSSYFDDICAALKALPFDRLATEAKVLAAEAATTEHPAVGEHLRRRYGLRGVGLAGVEPPAVDQLDADLVAAYVERHFTRDNAALALTGEPPADLHLDLPPGARAVLKSAAHLKLPLPMWFDLGGPSFAISFLINAANVREREVALTVLRIALDRAVDELRHRNGWLYHIDFTLVTTTLDEALVCFVADPPVTHAEDVRRGLSDILRALRDAGPTEEELAEDLGALREHFDDPRAAEAAVSGAAGAHLVGHPVQQPDERLMLREQVTVEQCRDVLRSLDNTLMVGMPPETVPADPALTVEPQFSEAAVVGKSFARSWLRGSPGLPPRTHLVVGDAGVSLILRDGRFTILWDDLVGAAREDTVLTLVGADGFTVSVDAHWFRHGDQALKLIEQHIDPRLMFTRGG